MKDKEIEYKYWAGEMTKDQFTQVVRTLLPEAEERYIVSCDDYYLNEDDDFVRFRKSHGFFELTVKRKEDKNVVRQEINLDISNNDTSSVSTFLNLIGYKRKFQVYKEAWIWHSDDCDISFYTLADGRCVIELEATKYQDIRQGVWIINKWENDLNLQALQKEQRSLFEIFLEETRQQK